jgi:hypothetical protein
LVREQVVDMHCDGFSLREIARQMTAQRERTPAGLDKPWHHSHVDRLLRTRLAKEQIARRQRWGWRDAPDDDGEGLKEPGT